MAVSFRLADRPGSISSRAADVRLPGIDGSALACRAEPPEDGNLPWLSPLATGFLSLSRGGFRVVCPGRSSGR